jgi:hypothetical protein
MIEKCEKKESNTVKGEKFILNKIYNFQSFIHFTVYVKSGNIKIP